MKRLVVEMEDCLHKEIKMEALRQGKPSKQLVTELMENYIRKEGKNAGTIGKNNADTD